MTIETLIHIYRLLQNDVEAKRESAKEACKHWHVGDGPHPLENPTSEYRIALDKARSALHEFETKEWN